MPVRINSGELAVRREAYQLIIDFDNDSATVTEYTFAEKGIYVKDWGTVESNYQEEDFVIAVGIYKFALVDADKYIYTLFYRDSSIISKKAKVTLMAGTIGALATEYVGYLIPRDCSFDDFDNTFYLTVAPRTDRLKSTALWYDKPGRGTVQKDGTDAKKLNGTETAFTDEIPLDSWQNYYVRIEGQMYALANSGHSSSVLMLANNFNGTVGIDYGYEIVYALNPFIYTENDDILLKDLILDIARSVNSDLTIGDILLEQLWVFMAWSQGDLINVSDINSGAITQVDDVTFEELYCDNYLYIFDHTNQYATLMELLKQLCLEYGAIAGFIGEEGVFFAMLYDKLSTSIIDLTSEKLISPPKFNYDAEPIEYVRFSSDYLSFYEDAGVFTDDTDLKIEKSIPNAFFLNGTNSRALQAFGGLRCEREHNGKPQDFYVGLAKDTRLSYPDAEHTDPNLDVLEHPDYEQQMRILADIHFRYRGSLDDYFHAEFELNGTNIKIFNVIQYKDTYGTTIKDEYYQPIRVKVNYQTGISNIKARRIEEVT